MQTPRVGGCVGKKKSHASSRLFLVITPGRQGRQLKHLNCRCFCSTQTLFCFITYSSALGTFTQQPHRKMQLPRVWFWTLRGGGKATEDQISILVATEEGLSAVRVFGCVRSHSCLSVGEPNPPFL